MLGSRSNAAFSNVESRLPRVFHPREPPGTYVSQLTTTLMAALSPPRVLEGLGDLSYRRRDRETYPVWLCPRRTPSRLRRIWSRCGASRGLLLFWRIFRTGLVSFFFLSFFGLDCVWLWCSWGIDGGQYQRGSRLISPYPTQGSPPRRSGELIKG